jgi:hypothetical protein
MFFLESGLFNELRRKKIKISSTPRNPSWLQIRTRVVRHRIYWSGLRGCGGRACHRRHDSRNFFFTQDDVHKFWNSVRALIARARLRQGARGQNDKRQAPAVAARFALPGPVQPRPEAKTSIAQVEVREQPQRVGKG